MKTPVLFLIFNRPDRTAEVFEAIRLARPARLYIAADGPRDRAEEAERCAEARRIAGAVDWPCKVQTLFRDSNLGCRAAVSEAISWFFKNEPEGIILEDDCLPSPTFFQYCAELLVRYRHDRRVMCITGDNFQKTMGDYPYSYYFSRYNHCWGWASWRRSWELYDAEMTGYPEFIATGVLSGISSTDGFSEYWQARFAQVLTRQVDTWDYVWTYSCWANNGLTCTPRVNLVSNTGFGPDSTHTRETDSKLANLPTAVMEFPLVGPRIVTAHQRFDSYVEREVLRIDRRAKMHQRAARKAIRLVRGTISGRLMSGNPKTINPTFLGN